jgi:gamma-glutamyl phosphate reductase
MNIGNSICQDGFGKCVVHDTERVTPLGKFPLEALESYKYVVEGTD